MKREGKTVKESVRSRTSIPKEKKKDIEIVKIHCIKL